LPRLDHSPFELILTRLCASQSWLLPCCHSRGRGTYETCIQDSLSYFGLWTLDGIKAVLVAGVCVYSRVLADDRSVSFWWYRSWIRSSNIALNITDKQRQGAVKLQRVSEKEQASRKMALNIAKIIVIKRDSFNTKVACGLHLRRTLHVSEYLNLDVNLVRESAQTCLWTMRADEHGICVATYDKTCQTVARSSRGCVCDMVLVRSRACVRWIALL